MDVKSPDNPSDPEDTEGAPRGPSSDPLKTYLKEMRAVALLTKEEEIGLVKEIEQCDMAIRVIERLAGLNQKEVEEVVRNTGVLEEKIRRAKDHLIRANLRLVVSIARGYANRGLQLPDLIQEGNIGLMIAMDKFEYQRGFRFSTYATWWIRQSIVKAIANQGKTIRVPLHMVDVINKFVRTSHSLLQEKGREPTAEELSEKMGLSVEKISEILKTMQEPVSLERPVGGEGDALLEDFIEASPSTTAHDEITKNELAGQINETLSTLSPREEKVLRMRFGIGESKSYTLDEVGEYFHLNRERVRQIEVKALRKLRHPGRAKNLRTFSDK